MNYKCEICLIYNAVIYYKFILSSLHHDSTHVTSTCEHHEHAAISHMQSYSTFVCYNEISEQEYEGHILVSSVMET